MKILNYFKYSLSFELWEDIFAETEVNIIFNSLLNTFLKKFHSHFPLIRKTKNNKIIANDTGWVTTYIKHLFSLKRDFYVLTKNYNNIKIMNHYKRDIYLLTKNCNDIKIMNHYKFICNILAYNIKETKRSYHNTKITTSENKIKAWNTVKSITKRSSVYKELKTLNIDGKCSKDYQIISNSLNDYFI